VTSSCPDYLHAWRRLVSSLSSQQEATDGQLVTMSLQCARSIRLWCSIGVSPLLTLPFTGEGVLRGQQLRTLCLETELEKRKKKSGVRMFLSVLLYEGGRVRTVYRIGRLVFSMFIVRMCTYVW